MIAILTEKPSVGKDIARVLGVTQKKEGYMEGNGYIVTWAYGHLVQPALPEDYGINVYRRENLPIIPRPFKLIPRKIKAGKGYKTDTTAFKQLGVIKTIFSKCDSIIVATDAGREGELIFRFIYNYLKCGKPFSRLWISSLTDKAIEEGFKNLKDGKCYDNLYLAAEARNKADWLIGINASRALCVASEDGNNSLGRVQTPTLAMICSRYLENRRFVPQPYWQHMLKINIGTSLIATAGVLHYTDKNDAEKDFQKLKDQKEVVIIKSGKKEMTEKPPLLHDLASLQKEANIRYGYTAGKTLEVAQKLYEKKYITYPRTGSRYIPDDVFETIPTLISSLKDYPVFSEYTSQMCNSELCKGSVDNSKITDHHALLVTGLIPSKTDKEESRIYELIAGRMLEAFSTPLIKDISSVEFNCMNIRFHSECSRIKDYGWKAVFGKPEEDTSLFSLPEEGARIPIESLSMVQKNTKAKPLYTDASLLTAMETAGKDIEDEEVREAMKGSGIGTPATRAAIIETLLKREYIDRNNKSLVPTKKGLELYESVKKMRIADVDMTGGWEMAISKIEKSPDYYDTFLKGLEIYVRQAVDEIISLIQPRQSNIESPYVCPKCKLGKMTFFLKLAKCNYSKCKLTVFRTKNGISLNDENLSLLFKTGMTGLIKGFRGASGKRFEAFLKLDENFNLIFDFPTDKTEGDGTGSTAQ